MFADCDDPWASPHHRWGKQWRTPLLLLAALLAAAFIYSGVTGASKRRGQQEAFAKLQALGGVFGWDGADKFYGVNLSKRRIGDEEMALIEVFDEFDHVDVGQTRVTDAGIRHLSGLRGLHLLYMADTQVSDEGLAHLSELRQLKALSLAGTQVTDSGLRHLEGMKHLTWLSLSRTRVSDAGIVHLKKLPALRDL